MKVHPTPNKKRNIAVLRFEPIATTGRGEKKLRRLPHVFPKVLELPFAADADVAVDEGPDAFRFAAATDGFGAGAGIRAHAVEIHPGIMKVVVRAHGDEAYVELRTDELELDRWRFRLPDTTRPALATADYVEGELVVTVPKGSVGSEQEELDGGRL